MSDFINNANEKIMQEIRNAIIAMYGLRLKKDLKPYRSLVDVLERLSSVFETTAERRYFYQEEHKRHIEYFPIPLTNFLKCVIKDIETEVNELLILSDILLKESDFHLHRDCVLSYQKLIILRERLKYKYKSNVKIHETYNIKN